MEASKIDEKLLQQPKETLVQSLKASAVRVGKLKKELDEKNMVVDKLLEERKTAEREAKKVIEAAQGRHDEIISAAIEEAEKKKAEAERHLTNAESRADSIIAARLSSAKDEIAGLEAQREDYKRDTLRIMDEVTELFEKIENNNAVSMAISRLVDANLEVQTVAGRAVLASAERRDQLCESDFKSFSVSDYVKVEDDEEIGLKEGVIDPELLGSLLMEGNEGEGITQQEEHAPISLPESTPISSPITGGGMEGMLNEDGIHENEGQPQPDGRRSDFVLEEFDKVMLHVDEKLSGEKNESAEELEEEADDDFIDIGELEETEEAVEDLDDFADIDDLGDLDEIDTTDDFGDIDAEDSAFDDFADMGDEDNEADIDDFADMEDEEEFGSIEEQEDDLADMIDIADIEEDDGTDDNAQAFFGGIVPKEDIEKTGAMKPIESEATYGVDAYYDLMQHGTGEEEDFDDIAEDVSQKEVKVPPKKTRKRDPNKWFQS